MQFPAPQALTAPDGTPASRFCFGTMQFGGTADVDASRALYDQCRAAGINFFDTAHVYTKGQSETLLGGFAAPERERLIIATKCAYVGGSGRANILKSCDESLSRLGMDQVDILYLHRWDPDTPLTETFAALAALREAGKIRHVGLSNFAAWQVMKAISVARDFGIGIAILQPMYNLVKRQAEVEILPMAAYEGLSVAPYSPLGGGLLTGKYQSEDGNGRLTEDERYGTRYGQSWMHDTAHALAALASEHGVHPATLAVAWVARNPAITAPILSARNTEQLAPSLQALDYQLTDALYDQITGLSRRPAPATDRLEET